MADHWTVVLVELVTLSTSSTLQLALTWSIITRLTPSARSASGSYGVDDPAIASVTELPGRKRRLRITTSLTPDTWVWRRASVMPSPGADWPAIVILGLLMLSVLCSWIVPPVRKRIVRPVLGADDSACRRVP